MVHKVQNSFHEPYRFIVTINLILQNIKIIAMFLPFLCCSFGATVYRTGMWWVAYSPRSALIIYRKLHVIYRNLHVIYHNLHVIYSNLHVIYHNLHVIFEI